MQIDDVQVFHVTATPGTTAAAPQVVALSMPPRTVVGVEIVVPDGPRGNCGIALGAAGTRFIPSNPGGYIISNDEIIRWPYAAGLNSGSWQAMVYNTGTFAHTYEVRFLLRLLSTTPVNTITFLPAAALSGNG